MKECPEAWWISAFHDDELSIDQRALLTEHLGICARCRKELEALDQLRSTLKGLQTDPTVRGRVLRSLFAGGVYRRTSHWKRLTVPVPVAAMVLLVLMLSVLTNGYLAFTTSVTNRRAGESVGKGPDGQDTSSSSPGFSAGKVQSESVTRPGAALTPGGTLNAKGSTRSTVAKKLKKDRERHDSSIQSTRLEMVVSPTDSSRVFYRVVSKEDYRLNRAPVIVIRDLDAKRN